MPWGLPHPRRCQHPSRGTSPPGPVTFLPSPGRAPPFPAGPLPRGRRSPSPPPSVCKSPAGRPVLGRLRGLRSCSRSCPSRRPCRLTQRGTDLLPQLACPGVGHERGLHPDPEEVRLTTAPLPVPGVRLGPVAGACVRLLCTAAHGAMFCTTWTSPSAEKFWKTHTCSAPPLTLGFSGSGEEPRQPPWCG